MTPVHRFALLVFIFCAGWIFADGVIWAIKQGGTVPWLDSAVIVILIVSGLVFTLYKEK